jgi:Bifunctional DNA primase/polymerase, N-terminal
MIELDPQLRDYLDRHWPIFPCSWQPGDKRPLIEGGFYGASTDPKLVASWQRQFPKALWALRTGRRPPGAGIAVVDVDIKHRGFNTLARLGGGEIPAVPRVTTPSGGLHLYYLAPLGGCFSTVGVGGKRRQGLGPGLDLKCDLSMCHLPGPSPVSRYSWDPIFNLHTHPLLPLPAALTPVEVPDEDEELGAATAHRRPIGHSAAYAARAIANACQRIREAVPGTQRNTLNGEALSIGRLVAGLGLDRASVARDLVAAGMAMANQAGKRPWRQHEVRKYVLDALTDGARRPSVPQLRSQRRQ